MKLSDQARIYANTHPSLSNACIDFQNGGTYVLCEILEALIHNTSPRRKLDAVCNKISELYGWNEMS